MAKKNQLTTSDHLPYDEFTRFLECLRQDGEYRWEMYARLSFCTACRASDTLQFKWRDILGVSSVTIVEQKTGKARRIPFNPSVQKSFNELWKLLGCPDKGDYVMPSSRGDQPMTIQYINQRLKYFKDRYHLKIENFSTHTFRKTFGRYVYDSNNHSAESLILLNKILNHSTIQVTKTYIGITQEEVDGIYASINM
jgi:integrase